VYENSWFVRLLYQAITFGGSPKFANLSRTNPARISTGVGSLTYFHAVGGGTLIVFLLTIVVKDCNLLGGVGHCCAWHVRVPSGLIGYYVK
jgi:hypothetical protein